MVPAGTNGFFVKVVGLFMNMDRMFENHCDAGLEKLKALAGARSLQAQALATKAAGAQVHDMNSPVTVGQRAVFSFAFPELNREVCIDVSGIRPPNQLPRGL